MRGFRFLPHSVTSDVAFEATGKAVDELFQNAAAATFSVMCDLKKVRPKEKRKISIGAQTLEDLLFTFLDELIFLKDRDSMLFSSFEIGIKHYNNTYHCNGKVLGERIDPLKHNLGVDVKAVTKHNFSVKKEGGVYKATVVLDI